MNRISKKGKIKIIDDEYIEKEEKDLKKIYDYLLSRDFTSFVPLIEHDRDISKYRYIEDLSASDYQKSEDLIKTISSLHNKTSFNKEVSKETYKKIYEDMLGYINYLEEYYNRLLVSMEYSDFPSPSETLMLENFYKLEEVLSFLKREIDNWYNMVKDKTKQRVCLNHGKLELQHLLKNDKNYLISMDKANFSSPINDLVRFYHKEWENVEFSSLLDLYLKHTTLNPDEIKLLLINITIPKKIELSNNEYKNVTNVRKLFDYIFKTEELIRPYYSSEQTE
ncbi:MAG: hypothetical protein J5982_04350 [Bacilli bacterium]|nr:hypothetical protein [Bacilli bacterium]